MNSKDPFVTIFILVYNNAEGLAATIESIMKQDYSNAEIIISDDGSKNYDLTMLEDYATILRQKYESVTININEANMGTVKHLNRVFKMAKGEFLFSCSSGDRYASTDTVRKLVQYFSKTDYLVVTTRRRELFQDGSSKMSPFPLLGAALRMMPGKLLNYMIRKRNLLSGCCTFYSKELFERYGSFDEAYSLVEDYPYYIELLRKKVSIGWYPLVTVEHEIGGVSTGHVHPKVYQDIELLRERLYQERNEFSTGTRHFLEQCHKEAEDKKRGN